MPRVNAAIRGGCGVSVSGLFAQAVAAHRRAGAHLRAARDALPGWLASSGVDPDSAARQRSIAGRLQASGAVVTPGWLGCHLDDTALDLRLGADTAAGEPVLLRLGEAVLWPDCIFPVAVPLLGAGHLAVDADARDSTVAGLLRGVLLRLVAAVPDGMLRVLPVDAATMGSVFAPFHPLVDADVW